MPSSSCSVWRTRTASKQFITTSAASPATGTQPTSRWCWSAHKVRRARTRAQPVPVALPPSSGFRRSLQSLHLIYYGECKNLSFVKIIYSGLLNFKIDIKLLFNWVWLHQYSSTSKFFSPELRHSYFTKVLGFKITLLYLWTVIKKCNLYPKKNNLDWKLVLKRRLEQENTSWTAGGARILITSHLNLNNWTFTVFWYFCV